MSNHNSMNKKAISDTDKQLDIVETFTASNGGTVEVVGKKLDTKVMARFLLGLPQVNNSDTKKTA